MAAGPVQGTGQRALLVLSLEGRLQERSDQGGLHGASWQRLLGTELRAHADREAENVLEPDCPTDTASTGQPGRQEQVTRAGGEWHRRREVERAESGTPWDGAAA